MQQQTHWDRYAHLRPHRRAVNEAGASTWFNWTQYPDHGPGIEILDLRPGASVLDLGCGKGGNLAHIDATGHRGIGVDLSPMQLRAAAERWPALNLVHADALAYLDSAPQPTFDAVYSVFGAVWFADPDRLLPAIHRRLRGVLAFSYCSMEPVPGLARWDLEADQWTDELTRHGFADVKVTTVPPPAGLPVPTVIVTAGCGRCDG